MSYKFNQLQISIAAALLVMGSAHVTAGGFAIATQSGSGTGNAFAGGAAVAEDASVVWSNPAGMTALPQGITVTGALHGVRPSFKFNDGGSTGAFAAPGTGNGGDGGGEWVYIPNGFLSMSIGPSLRLGLALNAPFGLTTDYDIGWRGQLTALRSSIKTVNIQPSIAYKINDMFSIGGGVSYQKIDATLTNFTGAATGFSQLKAGDWGYGFNLGATIQPASGTRIGLHYRSSIKYKLDGTAIFAGGPFSPAASGGVTADLKTPDSASASIVQQITSNLDLLGDITWTGWSKIQNLTVIRTTAAPGVGAAAGSTLTNLPFLWDNTWRFGIGANYKLSQAAKLRAGLAFDQTPTKDLTRTPRLPDQNRTWLAFGFQYKPTKNGALDIAYAHEFVRNASVNTNVAPGSNLIGTFKDKADIISIQYSHTF